MEVKYCSNTVADVPTNVLLVCRFSFTFGPVHPKAAYSSMKTVLLFHHVKPPSWFPLFIFGGDHYPAVGMNLKPTRQIYVVAYLSLIILIAIQSATFCSAVLSK